MTSQLYLLFYADFAPTSTNTVGSNSNTNSQICSVNNSNDTTNNATNFIISTTDVVITSSTTDHLFSGSTPIITNNATRATNNSDDLSSRSGTHYPVIVSSVAGGLLGLCFMLCIVGLLLKRKLTRKHKTDTFSPVNSLFYRYTIASCYRFMYVQTITGSYILLHFITYLCIHISK